MTERYAPIPRNIVSGNDSFSAYDRNGASIRSSELEEVVLIRLDPILGTGDYLLDFNKLGYPVHILTIYCDWVSDANSELILVPKHDKIQLDRIKLKQNDLPYSPPNLVMGLGDTLKFVPNIDVDSITLVCKQVAILEKLNL